MFAIFTTVTVLLSSLASASENLAYLSPSTNHPGLAIHNHEHFYKRDLYSGALNFSHGIASGDPYKDSVVLWTRAVPQGVNGDLHLYNGTGSQQVCVAWEIWRQSGCATPRIVNNGTTQTSGDVDYTVKVIADKLNPFTTYEYRFKSCDGSSSTTTGRTKTIPHEGQTVGSVKFAVYSCSNYAEGFFNAYGNPAKKDRMDYVLFLGDYQYEFNEPTFIPGRDVIPKKETVLLEDYRTRISLQRTDPDLLLNHEKFAWIPIWDDHEVANNGWNDDSGGDYAAVAANITWYQRKQNGFRAYFEWMPIRQVDANEEFRIWRNFKFGNLVDLSMLDTRYDDRDRNDFPEGAQWKNTTIIGDAQENWLYDNMQEAKDRGTVWTVFGNQVQFSNINETANSGLQLYYDGWMQYQTQRQRVMQKIVDIDVSNPVFLTGDYHALWTAELSYPEDRFYNWTSGDGSIGLELATTAVSSYSGYGILKPLNDCQNISTKIVADNYQVKWAEGFYRGYFIIDFTPEQMTADFYSVKTVTERTTDEVLAATWVSQAGSRKFQRPFGQVKTGVLQTTINPWADRKEPCCSNLDVNNSTVLPFV